MTSFPHAADADEPIRRDLDRLAVLASTFRDERSERREALAASLSVIGGSFAEHLLLHTCHRVELIAVLDGEPPALPAGIRQFTGVDAVERVLLVAAGFDSAVTAEEQLIGQVREAYRAALARGTTGPMLNELLRRALRLGRRVRSHASATGDRSLADGAARWALGRLARRDEGRRGRAALVIGTGEMGRLLAARFSAAGLTVTVASRRLERAERAAEALPPDARTALLDDALAGLAAYDVAAVAVRGGGRLLDEQMLAGRRRPVVVDLSSPAAVTDEVRSVLGDDLLDLDALGHAEAASPLTPRAERRLRADLAAERDAYVAWLEARERGEAVAALRRHADELQRRHIDRLRRRGDLHEEQLAAVEAAISALLGELLHAPTTEIRSGSGEAEGMLAGLGVDR